MLASAVLFTALDTWAQPEAPTRVQLAFKAPSACADSDEFERRVKQRSDRIAFVSEAPFTGTAKVTLEPAAGSVRVRLSWSRDGASATGREFSAASCSEALDAAALVITISFDPSAPETSTSSSSETGEPATAEAPPSPPAAAAAAGRNEDPNAEPPAASDSSDLAIPMTDAGVPLRKAAPDSGVGVVFGSSALLQGLVGVAPTAMAGIGLNVELAIGQGWLAPQLRLAGVHYFGVTYRADGGDARFELDTLELFACPLRLGSAEFSLRPCATLVGGQLVASGRATENPSSHQRALWIIGGALALGVRPTSLLLLSADLGVGAPTARDSFQFAPEQFHQVWPVLISGSLGVGVEFR